MKKIKILSASIAIGLVTILMLNSETTTLNKNASIIQVNSNIYGQSQGIIYYAKDLIPNTKELTKIKKNTTYLQNLIDSASKVGGGIVHIPAGTYYFAESAINGSGMGSHVIKCKNNVTVEGEGTDETNSNECTILKPYGISEAKSGGIDMFYFNEYSDSKSKNPKYLENADFKNLIIDGGEVKLKGSYDSSGKGILTLLSRNCDCENIVVKNTIATGIGIDLPINCTIKNCKAINCGRGVTSKNDTGGSGFGIGTGYSEEETMYISNCVAEGNGKFGFFFEHQGRFGGGKSKYPATKGEGFVVSNCTASGNMYDFGAARGSDVTYENCISNYSYNNPNVTNISSFNFENMSRRIHIVNCEVEQKFTDVKSSKYYYEPVYWALNNAITNGTSKTTFSPNKECTRGQAITLIWRMAEMPGEIGYGGEGALNQQFKKAYTDLSSTASYLDAVKWAKDTGIADSTSTTFSPNAGCTRAEFVTFLWKYAGEPKVKTKNNFIDVPSGSKYENAVNWAVTQGIVKGTSTTEFSPNAICKRGDAVTFLYRFANTKNKFSITYNLNGGTAKSNLTSYKSGEYTFTLNNPVKPGYTFLGWTGSNNIGKNSWTPEKTVTISKDDVGNKTYTANWATNNYKISFNANGGVGSMEDEYFTYDLPQTLLANEFTRSNYTFKGWNTKADGTGKVYSNKEAVMNLTENSDETITLYAQWQKVITNPSKTIIKMPLPIFRKLK